MSEHEYAPPTHVMNEWRKNCTCDERYSPCDGVMAGGFCDDQNDCDEWDEKGINEEF